MLIFSNFYDIMFVYIYKNILLFLNKEGLFTMKNKENKVEVLAEDNYYDKDAHSFAMKVTAGCTAVIASLAFVLSATASNAALNAVNEDYTCSAIVIGEEVKSSDEKLSNLFSNIGNDDINSTTVDSEKLAKYEKQIQEIEDERRAKEGMVKVLLKSYASKGNSKTPALEI
jgi:hypothetical protein